MYLGKPPKFLKRKLFRENNSPLVTPENRPAFRRNISPGCIFNFLRYVFDKAANIRFSASYLAEQRYNDNFPKSHYDSVYSLQTTVTGDLSFFLIINMFSSFLNLRL